jgi:hypothetical protein
VLKHWKVENFKSIVSSGELPLAPVTVFAGLNSSGKSSLLQSILMVAQTLSNPTPTRALLPNGSLIQLGRFEDILHQGANPSRITLAFELDFSHEFEDEARFEENLEDELLFIDETGSPAQGVRLFTSFSHDISQRKNPTSDASSIVLDQLSLQITPRLSIRKDDMEYAAFTVECSRFDEAAFTTFSKHITNRYTRLIPSPAAKSQYVGHLYRDTQAMEDTDEEEGIAESEQQVWGPYIFTLAHFLPDRLLRTFPIRQEQAPQLPTNCATRCNL